MQNNNSKMYIIGGVAVILLVTLLYLSVRAPSSPMDTDEDTMTSDETGTDQDTAAPPTPTPGQKPTGGYGTPKPTVPFNPKETYTNNAYHFALRGSFTMKMQYTYSPFHHIGQAWRSAAQANNQGEGIIEVLLYTADHPLPKDSPYPLFYRAVARVAVGKNTGECYSDDGGMSKNVGETTFGGATWKVFTYEDAAMMQFLKSKNYRTIHNGYCYSLEQLATGSHYRDETMKPGLTDAQLDAYFNAGESVLKSFTFTK